MHSAATSHGTRSSFVDGYHCYHGVICQRGGAASVANDSLPDEHPEHHAEPSAAAALAQR